MKLLIDKLNSNSVDQIMKLTSNHKKQTPEAILDEQQVLDGQQGKIKEPTMSTLEELMLKQQKEIESLRKDLISIQDKGSNLLGNNIQSRNPAVDQPQLKTNPSQFLHNRKQLLDEIEKVNTMLEAKKNEIQ